MDNNITLNFEKFLGVLRMLKNKNPLIVLRKLNQLILIFEFGVKHKLDITKIIKLMQEEIRDD